MGSAAETLALNTARSIGDGVPLSDILAFHADRDPDRPAVTMGDETISRRALDEWTNRLARAFQDKGVGRGDYVTIGLPNSIGFFAAVFATWKCGATPNPISWRLPTPEAQAIIDLVQPALVVGGPPELNAAVFLETLDGVDIGYSSAPLPSVVSDYWKAISSGGSTGRPKIIVSHRNTLFDPLSPPMGQVVDGTVLTIGPMYNNGPFMGTMMALFSGNHVVVTPRFDELTTLQLIDRYKVTWLFLVPTMMNRIWRLGDDVRAQYDMSSLNAVFHSASMCPIWLKQAWIDWLGADRIFEGYGGTEQQGTAMITGRDWLEHKGSVGRAIPGSRILILDPDGKPLPAGEIGEIFFLPDDPDVKSYHYIGAERREVGAAGSVGDMGYLDADGWLYIADRRTDMIVSGGANIYPAEVEAALDAHPAILSSIAIGLPDPDMVAIVHAIVQVDPAMPEPDVADIKDFLKQRIVTFKIPRSFEFVHHNLRDDAGKARRSQLREERIARI